MFSSKCHVKAKEKRQKIGLISGKWNVSGPVNTIFQITSNPTCKITTPTQTTIQSRMLGAFLKQLFSTQLYTPNAPSLSATQYVDARLCYLIWKMMIMIISSFRVKDIDRRRENDSTHHSKLSNQVLV